MKKMTVIAVMMAVLLGEKTQLSGQTTPPNMALIPAGAFQMGDSFNEGNSDERPVHTVYVSALYMDKYEVTKALWDEVYQWAISNGYNFDSSGLGKSPNHPVQPFGWYDAVKWCNARSEKENRVPAYYISATQTTVYRTGDIDIQNDWVKWNAGYRLPTEAEWEKAARGGASGHRFPWSDTDTISHSRANYYSDADYVYDTSATRGFHPTFNNGVFPFTSPVGYFDPNGYGLYDMAGNVWEWCWDLDGSYSSSSQADPRGPMSGWNRVNRGGSWYNCRVGNCRVANRDISCSLDGGYLNPGFRSVLPSTAPDPVQVTETQPVQPTYGELPKKEDGKDSLIVVTHGWQLFITPIFPLPDVLWVNSMSDSINNRLTSQGLTKWQVYGFKWVNNAWTFFPTDALNNAKQEGLKLGNWISTQGWSNIHLIGHSAGAMLIQVASELIKSNSPNTTVHCTFMDAYVGERFEGVETYGKGSDWSDSYFSRDALTRLDSVPPGPFTESPLDYAYNTDVTWLDPNKIIGAKFRSSVTGEMEPCIKTLTSHGWPIDFYSNTITGTVTSEYKGFGFQLSKESDNWKYATNNYTLGNGTSIRSNIPTKVLGPPDPKCITEIKLTPPVWPNWLTDFTTWPTFQSTSGSVQKGNGWTILNPGSPVWLATSVSPTNPVNTVSFDAMFVGTNGSDSLLSVYWETNVIGTVDELHVQPGFQHYSLSFPQTTANSTHVFGLRLDPFTNAPSSIILTNVVFTQIGVSQPFSLSVITNTGNGLLVYELAGEPGFEYSVQASTNLVDWTDIAILANTTGRVKFFDRESASYDRRFYRVVAPY